MATESFELSHVFPVSPDRLYAAWLDAKEHGAFIGGSATASDEEGGTFSAWDDYVQGRNLQLEPGRRILQAWRTTEFPEGADDSRLELTLEPAPGGTLLTLRHSNIPEGQAERYRIGWEEHYFGPMMQYFSFSPRAQEEITPRIHIVPRPASKKPAPGARPGAKAKRKPAAKKAGKKQATRKAATRKAAGKKAAGRKRARKTVDRKPVRKKRKSK